MTYWIYFLLKPTKHETTYNRNIHHWPCTSPRPHLEAETRALVSPRRPTSQLEVGLPISAMHMRAKVAAMDSPPVNKTHLFVYAVGFRTLPDGDKGVLNPCANEHVVPQAMWDAAFGETVQAMPFHLLFKFEKAKLISPPPPRGSRPWGSGPSQTGTRRSWTPVLKST